MDNLTKIDYCNHPTLFWDHSLMFEISHSIMRKVSKHDSLAEYQRTIKRVQTEMLIFGGRRRCALM